MENMRNRVDIELVNSGNRYKKLQAKPNYNHTTIFNVDLAVVHMKKIIINYNKPVYLGISILDISKTHMYDAYYNYFKRKYEENVK